MPNPTAAAHTAAATLLLLALSAALFLLAPVARAQDALQGAAASDIEQLGVPDFGPPAAPAAAPAAADAGASRIGLAPGLGAPAGEPRLRYQGVATVAYAEEPLTPFGAATLGCGLGFLSPTFQANYIGVSADVFQDGFACGRCITLQCDDQSCEQPGRELPALVADLCGSCTGSDVSVATPLFRNLTGRDPGSNPSLMVSWQVVSCAPYIEGNIKMLLKPGGSAYYQAIGVSNSVLPITAVMVNGQRLQHGTDNFWAWNPGAPIDPSAPLTVALASGRQAVRARVPALRSADLGVQFRSA